MNLVILFQSLFYPLCVFACVYGAVVFARTRSISPEVSIIMVLAVFGVWALLGFWLAWLAMPHRFVGNLIRILFFAGAVAPAVWALFQRRWCAETLLPVAFSYIAAVGLLLWTHWGGDLASPLRGAAERWTHSLPGDNQIPFDFATGIMRGHIPVPLHGGEWLSSDRPPLQTAFVLINPVSLFGRLRLYPYQAVAVALQMFVLLGAWSVARLLGVGRYLSVGVLLAVLFTPIVIVNGSFVWPKLLATSFLLGVAAFHLTPAFKIVGTRRLYGAVAGALAALAMLSHGGSVFALIGIAVGALIARQIGSWRYVSTAAVVALALYAPWSAYQRFADPPGDRLTKWHLAGSEQIDPRSLGQAIKDSYSSITMNEWLNSRYQNIQVLYASVPDVVQLSLGMIKSYLSGNADAASAQAKQIRILQFFGLGSGMGLIGLSFILLPAGVFQAHIRPLTVAVISSLGIWVLLMFKGGSTFIHQGSLFPEIGILIGAIAAFASIAAWFCWLLIGLHIAITILQYAI